jgi:hypothetical protein
MREICMSRSMSRMWKRSHGLAHWAPLTERGGNSDARTCRHRATSRLYRTDIQSIVLFLERGEVSTKTKKALKALKAAA